MLSRLIDVIGRWEARAGRIGGVPAGHGGGASPVKPEARHAGNRKLSELLSARLRHRAGRQTAPMRDRADWERI